MTIMMAMTKTKIMTTTKENDDDNVKINNDGITMIMTKN